MPEVSQSTPPTSEKSVRIPSSLGRKKKYCPDSVIVPFSMGWMRELVHRSTEGKVLGKRLSDIYYFSPEGIKLRSMIEIGNHLSKQKDSKLSLVNFTFAKECVFREPFEIERSAKQKSIISTPSATIKKETPTLIERKKTPILSEKKKTPTLSEKKKTPLSAPEKNAPLPKITPKTSKASLPKTSTPKLTIRNVTQGNKVKKKFTCTIDESSSISEEAKNKDVVDSRLRRNTRNASIGEGNAPKVTKAAIEQHLISVTKDSSNSETTTSEDSENTDSDPPNSFSRQTLAASIKAKMLSATQNRAKLKSVLPKNVDSNLYQPCTPWCPVAKYQHPTVQCSMCLCLFHQNCIPSIRKGLSYACKSCTTEKLKLYETLRHSKTSTSARSESMEENCSSDMPTDMDVSFLSPEIDLKMQQTRAELHMNSPMGTSFGSAISAGPGLGRSTSTVTNHGISSAGTKHIPILPKTVTHSPHLLSQLLEPQHSLNPNSGLRQKAPRNNVNLIRSRLVINRTPGTSIPQNLIRVGMRLPTLGNSITLPNSVVIRHLPEGRMVIQKGTFLSVPANTNPINALENLSKKISPQENWSTISRNNNAVNESPYRHAKKADISHNSIESRLRNVPNVIGPSNLSTSSSNNVLFDNSESNNAQSFNMNRFLTSFESLTFIFKKLSICDLLLAGQVCKSWKHLASQSSLWEKVYFCNQTVTDWKKCCAFLKKTGTKFIDFCGIIHPDPGMPFSELETSINLLSDVQDLIFDQIPSALLKAVINNMPQLRRLECHFVTDATTEPEIWSEFCDVELSPLRCLGRLVKLKIGSGGGIILNPGPEYLLPYLPNLRHVSLTGFKFGSHINLESLSQQKDLISLELGDCVGIEPEIYALLGCLTNLKSLRLENGGNMEDVELYKALGRIKGLEVLELMNFKIPTNLVDIFKNFHQLMHLNVWPDTTIEGPLINGNLLRVMSNCQDLSYGCWGIIADGEFAPETLEIKNSTEDKTHELTFEELFNKLVGILPECRVEVKCVPRDSWKEFCSTRR